MSKPVKDGEKISVTDAQYWGLDYFDIKNGQAFVNFVGLILKKDRVLLSFPKHYDTKNLSDEECVKAMKTILTLIAKGTSSSSRQQEEDSFPLAAYLAVQDYYRKYGLHFVTLKEYKKGYGGRIDWRRTMRKSDKVIQDKGLIFLPFVTVKIRNVGEFLADCMELVLTETYQNFSDYLDFLTPYKNLPKNPLVSNPKRCVKELKGLKSKFFKDSEKHLIDALIDYFEWKAQQSSQITLATTNFASYWESLVELYLEKGFYGIDEDKKIKWDSRQGGQIKFNAQDSRWIEDKSLAVRGKHQIRFDHIAFDDEKTPKEIYLFDSKYYNNLTDFDYKQAFYYYYLRQYYGKDYTIYNGLIAPTSGKYNCKVMVNRAEGGDEYRDGLEIYIHELNLKSLIAFAQSHLSEFRTIYLGLSKSESD